MDLLRVCIGLFAGYLLGSIPFSQIVVRLRGGPDLREMGSRNVGGSNAIRAVGWGWGLLAAGLDVSKGPTALALAWGMEIPWPAYLLAGLAAMVGHNYPVWLRFRGGKGAAVGAGISAWVAFPETVLGVLLSGILFYLTRNITLAVGSGLLLILGLTRFWSRPIESSLFIGGILLVLLIAILPEGIRMARQPGALREYFRLARRS